MKPTVLRRANKMLTPHAKDKNRKEQLEVKKKHPEKFGGQKIEKDKK